MAREATLERPRSGDDQAFGEMTEPYRGERQLRCYRFLGSVQHAEDVLQDTLLAAWRMPRPVRGSGFAAHLAVPDRDQPVSKCAASQRPPAAEGTVGTVLPDRRADPPG